MSHMAWMERLNRRLALIALSAAGAIGLFTAVGLLLTALTGLASMPHRSDRLGAAYCSPNGEACICKRNGTFRVSSDRPIGNTCGDEP